MTNEIETEEVGSWQEFLGLVITDFPKGGWCFRGVLDHWDLQTSTERVCEN